MKRMPFVIACSMMMLCFFISCDRLNRNNIQLTVSESDEYIKVFAHYNRNQTKEIDRYLQRTIGSHNNISFANSVIDAQLTLDDGTKLYMKKHPGDLIIKFNKSENSATSYKEIKDFAEGLKPVMK